MNCEIIVKENETGCLCTVDEIRYSQGGKPLAVHIKNSKWRNAEEFILEGDGQ